MHSFKTVFKSITPGKRNIVITVMVIAMTVIAMLIFWEIRFAGVKVWRQQMIESEGTVYSAGQNPAETFVAEADGIRAIRFCDDSGAAESANQTISVDVAIRDQAGRDVWRHLFSNVQLNTNEFGEWIDISQEKIRLHENETYELLIKTDNESTNAITVCFQTNAKAPFGKMYLFMCLLIIFILTVILIWLFKCKGRYFKTFFAVVLLLLGILCNLVVTPIGVPDEDFHLSEAYLLSDRMMGIGDGNTVLITESGISRVIKNADIQDTVHFWSDWIYGNQRVQWNSGRFVCPEMLAGYENAVYLMPASGLSLMRLLHAPYQLILLAGRMMNLLLLLIVSLLIMQRYQQLKFAVAAICLMPSTIWLASSFSYDTWNLSFSMAFVAYCLYCRERVRILKLKNISVMMLILVAFVPVKLIYGIIGLAVLIIPKPKWSNKRLVYGCGAALFAVAAVMFIARGAEAIAVLTTNTMDTRGIGGAEPDSYTLGWVLNHPFSTFLVYGKTVIQNTDMYITKGFLGDFYYQFVPDFIIPIVIALFLMLMMSALDSGTVDRRYRQVSRMIFLIGVLAVLSAFLFVFTNISKDGTGIIGGVQGRYFLPFLIFLPGIIHSDRLIRFMDNELGVNFRYMLVAALMLVNLWVLFCRLSMAVQGRL